MYNRQIAKCLKRSAMGLTWDNPNALGQPPYLCPFDLDVLVSEVQEEFEHGTPYDTYELLDRASEIRQERIQNGIKFLNLTKSETLAVELIQKLSKPPSRSWINLMLERTHLQLRDRRNIKLQRLTACSPEVFQHYYEMISPYVENCSPFLIFGADESMLETVLNGKVIVPEGITEAIAAQFEDFPHISVMCCHSVYGDVMPPFMIIPTITSMPEELKIFAESGAIDIACAPSGYMNRDCFLRWAITFINHLNIYRLKLPSQIRNSRALLFLDGHSSRACPLALWLLDKANVEVIIEPANTSHVIQMFDVVLASPFKNYFRQIFHTLESKDKTLFPTIISRLRNHAAQGIISAWSMASCISNRIKSARKTGIFPFNPDEICGSRFIIELTREQRERQQRRDQRRMAGLDINCKILTDPMMINEIKNKVIQQKRYEHLCLIPPHYNNYSAFVKEICHKCDNGASLLSIPPPICHVGIIPNF